MSAPTPEQLDFARRLAAESTLWAIDVFQRAPFNAKAPLIASIPAEEKVIGTVHLAGELTRGGNEFGTSTEKARLSLECLAADHTVDAVLLRVNSPGGTVAGIADLGDAVRATAAVKPTWAFVDDLCCSAAYYAASQADRIVASQRTTLVGSVGTMAVILDASRMMKNIGIEVIPVTSGKLKAAGLFGSEVTEEQREHFRELIQQTQIPFTEAVESGRCIRVAGTEIESGRVFLAEEAIRAGLIDGIGSFNETLEALSGTPIFRGGNMKTNPAATLPQLKAALPEASSDFLLEQLEREATIDAAKDAWIEHQANEIARLKIKPACGKAVETRSEFGGGDGGGDFTDMVAEKMKTGMDRPAAVAAVVKECPEAYAYFIEAKNPGCDVSHLIRR